MTIYVEVLRLRFCRECELWLPLSKFLRGIRSLPRGRRRYLAHRCRKCVTRNNGGALVATRIPGLALTDKGRRYLAEVECEQ